jgi:protein-L-isoaspartate(D-aspartate) O-methyltransferase
VLQAVARVARAGFVPAEHVAAAYVDAPVPIAHHQVTTQPSLVACMVEALELTGRERVLEVGAGLGWQTALLARLAAEVFAVERFAISPARRRPTSSATALLARTSSSATAASGLRGMPRTTQSSYRPRSRPAPPPLVEQLVLRGRLVQPIGTGGAEDVLLFRKDDSGRLWSVRRVSRARFVRL